MPKFKMKDIFTIPNIICYIRILLIPVFSYIYITADSLSDYNLAAIIVLFSSFTDLFDGLIARKFNMVTDLGKILDPLADKLTHILIAICLATRYPSMIILLIIMLIKEGFMAIMGIINLKKGRMMNGAMWFGKVCTATLFIGLFVLFLLPELSINVVNIIIGVMIIVNIYTFIRYIFVYRDMMKGNNHA